MGSWPRLATRILLAPVHLAAVASASRSFGRNPFLGSDRLNRWGLHARRVAVAQRLAQHRRERLAPALPAADREVFERDGILVKPDFLPPESFARLRAEIAALRAPAREVVQGDAVSRLLPLSPAVLERLPETRALVTSPAWRGLLDYVASTRVGPLLFIQTIYSHAALGEEDPQTVLHSDTFYPSMKCWLYLQDVPAEDGPFVYVPGSHRATPRRLWWERERSLSWRQGDDHSRRGSLRVTPAMIRRLGYGEPVTCAARANTLVIADTYGFHARGPSSRPSTRVALWAQGRRNPFLPWTGFSPTTVRAIGDRQAVLFWKLTDWLAHRGLGRQPWRDVGVVNPMDPPLGQGATSPAMVPGPMPAGKGSATPVAGTPKPAAAVPPGAAPVP
ncbi:phytanoyl-CoA dioxygenase family protein [Roseomonas elaeocarpi]|uniref:Phytanoyl-CoA dioxygenase family protein n=1 Tax=Roseomonas elaeocarpi TaxID=907779 RepID=A0ABV6JNM9_9PROT